MHSLCSIVVRMEDVTWGRDSADTHFTRFAATEPLFEKIQGLLTTTVNDFCSRSR